MIVETEIVGPVRHVLLNRPEKRNALNGEMIARLEEAFSMPPGSEERLAVIRAARVAAGLRGGEFVTPDDVKSIWPLIAPHRLFLASDAVLEGISEQQIVARLIEQVPVPR